MWDEVTAYDLVLAEVRSMLEGDQPWRTAGLDLAALRADPPSVMAACGMTADSWQADLLRGAGGYKGSGQQVLICCSRQSGKSQTAAALALLTALLEPPATVLIVSRVQRQSAELLRKVKDLYRGLLRGAGLDPGGRGRLVRTGAHARWRPHRLKDETTTYDDMLRRMAGEDGYREDDQIETVQESVLSMELANGSRIISLPGKADTVVGYSAISLLIVDEASRVADELYYSVRPMLAVSGGALVALSTPLGKRGWFYEAHVRCDDAADQGEREPWQRVRITAHDCPRIDADFLNEELAEIGQRWFNQEYLTEFVDPIGAVFMQADIDAAVTDAVTPLF